MPSGPATLSALAMLLAVTFMRCDCAVMAEPATLKMFMEVLLKGMVAAALLSCYCWIAESSDLIFELMTVRLDS